MQGSLKDTEYILSWRFIKHTYETDTLVTFPKQTHLSVGPSRETHLKQQAPPVRKGTGPHTAIRKKPTVHTFINMM